jgi:hypothetical protein
MTGRTTTIKTHGKRDPEKHENPKAEQPAELDQDLDRDLGDSFPASDTPAMTQPGHLKAGGPERKQPRKR